REGDHAHAVGERGEVGVAVVGHPRQSSAFARRRVGRAGRLLRSSDRVPGTVSMTWSILARDGHGRFGIAIASRFFAVGALTMHTQRGAGALATQALVNPLYGPAGLALLDAGHAPVDVVATLTAADAGRAQRQLPGIAAS